jgi:hypothetical protein
VTYRSRELSPLVRKATRSLPVVVITGLRQVGKTTFLLEDPSLRGRRYFSLDDFATLEAARREPEALVEGDAPTTIDEAHRSPELLTVIKKAVDRRRIPGRFVLSGSANLALLKNVSESLAGRAIYLTLHPFTRRERLGQASTQPLVLRLLDTVALPGKREARPIEEEEILKGGMPPVALGESRDPALWFLGYEQTYLERDVRQLSQVADLVSFRNLVRLTALRTAQVLNQSELARDAKLPVSTVARYLNLLETSFVVSRVPPFLKSRVSRLIKSPKVFISDSGLASHLTSVSNLSAMADEPMRGPLLETYVFQNLVAILGAHLPEAELSFWSVQGRYEIDFVVSHRRTAIGIEVKAGTRFRDSDLAGLTAFVEKGSGVRAGILAYNGREVATLGDRLYLMPLDILLS